MVLHKLSSGTTVTLQPAAQVQGKVVALPCRSLLLQLQLLLPTQWQLRTQPRAWYQMLSASLQTNEREDIVSDG
jgi:hypothetical protein